MAGGMNKRGRWGSLEDRLAAGRESDRAAAHSAPPPGTPRPAGLDPAPPTGATGQEPPLLKHCWVTDRHGRLPGLLLAWRQATPGAAWEGRVMHAVLEDDEWMLVDEWLPAGLLDPG